MYRPTWAEIDLKAVGYNVRQLKRLLARRTRLLAVVKANGYGHGAVAVSRLCLSAGAAALGVSSIEEAIVLREARIRSPILVLGSIYPFSNLRQIISYNLIPTISSALALRELNRLAEKKNLVYPYHLKVDTGMGRIGVSPLEAEKILKDIGSYRATELAGIYTHFSNSPSDKEWTGWQLKEFCRIYSQAKKINRRVIGHTANSAALFNFPESHLDMVRPGIALYGLKPKKGELPVGLRPALTLKTKIVFLKKVAAGCPISYGRTFITRRPTIVATLPVGYADGYSRLLSNRSEVLIRGERCPVLGRVTMDMIMVDVTKIKDIQIGEEVVLLGRQNNQVISAEEIAERMGTINYEVVCQISGRVPRLYKE